MPEKLMRWNGSEWVEVSLVRKEVDSDNVGFLEIIFKNDINIDTIKPFFGFIEIDLFSISLKVSGLKKID